MYEQRKERTRQLAIAIESERPFFSGVNARLISYKLFNGSDWDVFTEWIGGDTAAISEELMNDVHPGAVIDDVVSLEDVKFRLIEYSEMGNFWYVRKEE